VVETLDLLLSADFKIYSYRIWWWRLQKRIVYKITSYGRNRKAKIELFLGLNLVVYLNSWENMLVLSSKLLTHCTLLFELRPCLQNSKIVQLLIW